VKTSCALDPKQRVAGATHTGAAGGTGRILEGVMKKWMKATAFVVFVLATGVFSVAHSQNDEVWLKEIQEQAVQGNVDSQVKLGSMYFFGKNLPQNYTEAAKWYRKAAEQGNAITQFMLGRMYHEGLGVLQDYNEAANWFLKSAEQGFLQAQFRLGVIYYDGEGVPQDYSQAAKWYREAAEQGDAGSQLQLGAMYAEGKGVPQDYIQAHIWSNLSAAQGNETARNFRDIISKNMTPAQIVEAQRMAGEWLLKKNGTN